MARKGSPYISWVGQRIETKVTVDAVERRTTRYGECLLIKLHDARGRAIACWYNGTDEFQKGERYLLRARVTRHGMYQGNAETSVNQAKFIPLTFTAVRLTDGEIKLVSQWLDPYPVVPRDAALCQEIGLSVSTLYLPKADIVSISELLRWLRTQGPRGHRIVQKITKTWDSEEMGTLKAAAA